MVNYIRSSVNPLRIRQLQPQFLIRLYEDVTLTGEDGEKVADETGSDTNAAAVGCPLNVRHFHKLMESNTCRSQQINWTGVTVVALCSCSYAFYHQD